MNPLPGLSISAISRKATEIESGKTQNVVGEFRDGPNPNRKFAPIATNTVSPQTSRRSRFRQAAIVNPRESNTSFMLAIARAAKGVG